MDKMFAKFECEVTEDFKEVATNWMEAYSLDLKEINGEYALYITMFEKPEKMCDIKSFDDFVNAIAEHISLYSKEDLTDEEFLSLDEDYFVITGEHITNSNKLKRVI